MFRALVPHAAVQKLSKWVTFLLPALRRWRQEDKKFMIISSHIVSLIPAWITVSKREEGIIKSNKNKS